uniref:tRNA (guanosine(18)-2'-O)-methyltransferase TARBP1 n=2 Tax=Callorhinchus milii TaxID=7868 RepID=A0A4W3JS87_CALMI
MKPLVAELLLRSAPGPPWLLLRELCWDPESGELPEADRVETLRLCVDGLRAEVERRVEQARGGEPWCPASGREKSTASGAAAAEEEEEEGITGALREVASGRCLPLLQRLRVSGSGGSGDALRDSERGGPEERGRGRLVHSLCALLSGCCREAAPSLTGDIARLALGDVRAHSEERSAGAAGESGAGPRAPVYSDVHVAVEVLASVAPLLPRLPEGLELRDRVLSAVLTAVRAGDEGLASRAAARVIPALLATGVPLERLWDEVKSCEGPTGGPGAGCRRLLLLSSLSDHLFPPHRDGREAPDLRRCPEFWRVLQRGLVHRDNVSRKRAVYLLKRAVDVSRTLRGNVCPENESGSDPCLFWWLAEKNKLLVQLWENYILIMETLEENQVHVIRPVLPRLCSLLDATVSKGISLFHTSWVLCAYKRMFASENKTIIKEGLFHFLDVNVTKYPFITRMLSEFICGPLMDALSESTLYSRSPEQTVGSCPLLGVKLQVLLITFVESVPEQSKGDFLLQLIKSMGSKYWCAIPILFISRALAQIPSCKAWGVEGLHALREVLRCTMITHQVLLRGAAQCYLLQTTMNLTDVEKVSLSEISNFLTFVRAEESLSRGTKLWNELCEWLHRNDRNFRRDKDSAPVSLDKRALSAYVQNLVERYMKVSLTEGESNYMPDWFEAQLVAQMTVLVADVEEKYNTEGDSSSGDENLLGQFLYPLLDSLRKLNTHAYLPVVKADKSLQLLLKLLETCSSKCLMDKTEDRVLNVLQKSVMSSVEQVLEYTFRRLTSELQSVSDLDRCHLYLAVMSMMVKILSTIDWKKGSCIWSYISSLTQASLQHLQAASDDQDLKLVRQIQKAVAMASVAWVCETTSLYPELQLNSLDAVKTLVRFISTAPFNQTLEKPLWSEQDTGFLETGSSIQGWGKIAAQFVCNQWICIHFAFNKCDQFITSSDKNLDLSLPVVENPALTLQACTEALSIVPSDQVLPILQCMRILIPKVLGSREPLCVESLDLAWKAVLDLNSNQLYFWPTLNAFIKIAFHHQLLGVSAECNIGIKLKEILNQLFEISQTKIGVFNVLIAHCCQTWLPAVSASNTCLQDSFAIAQNHIDLFVEACLFGPVFRKDQRLIQDVHIFIELQGDDCAANVTTESENKDDQFVRIWAISFLCHLDGSDSLHKNFIEKLVNKLLEKDNELRNKKGRYYVNSMYHRVKTRIWQTLLVLLHHLDQNFVRKILETVYLSGFSDNQASVKYLIEWFIILILHKWPEFLDSFWRCFRFKQENTKSSICTFLAILVHIDVILKNVEEKNHYLKKALSVILPWCLNHNFSVRLYALLALQKVWEACQLAKMEGDDLQFLEPIVESSLEQAGHKQSTGNAGKNWQRIQEHFFFETFQPLEDYSLETFFYTFPSLSDVIEDEWIPVWKFKRVMDLSSSTSVVNLFNSRNKLSELKSTDWVQRDKGYSLSEADLDAEWTDVQKKIIPWKNSIPDQDLELIYQERATKLGKSSNSSSSLIVVASLIDKPTNLGGLCRTSEIFGASVLVVNNMHCVNDKQFQALSVSAEQWMPVIEVKPAQLVEYLQQKKTEGYTIIGVEQTANSQDLTQYRFPEKTLLLLGNEREGIPANLIQHLDVCVEIPQYGVIRSLNVHVSGALLVWEYTRQQMMTNSSGP